MTHHLRLIAAAAAFFAVSAAAQNQYLVTTYEEASPADSTEAAPAANAEEAFLAEHFPYRSLCDWQPGMRFMVVPGERDAFIRTFTDSVSGREVGTGDLKYKTMEYRGHELTPRGWTHLNFYCVEDQKAYYHELRNMSFGEYCQRVQGGGVAALAYLGDVDTANALLVGRDLWLKSPIVYRDSPSSSDGYVERQLTEDAHVRVERVGVGTREYPVKIVFRADDGQLYFNTVAMSRTNSGMLNDDFIMTKAHRYFANAFSMGSQSDTKSAKMSARLLGKYVTLRRACNMTQGGNTVSMKAATKFVVQSVKARGIGNEYTLVLTNGGKIYRKDVTFENTNVAGNIDGNDESYFDELFTIGDKYVPSNSQIRRTHVGTHTRGRGHTTTTTVTEANGSFTNLIGGVISRGMTQEEVRMAKGDPERRHTLSKGGTQWDYYDGTKVQFNTDGRVSRIIR